MQTAEKGVYSGAFDVVRKTIRKEGLRRGLYAGVSAQLIGVTPIFAVSFWGYDVGKGPVKRFGKVNYKNKRRNTASDRSRVRASSLRYR